MPMLMPVLRLVCMFVLRLLFMFFAVAMAHGYDYGNGYAPLLLGAARAF